MIQRTSSICESTGFAREGVASLSFSQGCPTKKVRDFRTPGEAAYEKGSDIKGTKRVLILCVLSRWFPKKGATEQELLHAECRAYLGLPPRERWT